MDTMTNGERLDRIVDQARQVARLTDGDPHRLRAACGLLDTVATKVALCGVLHDATSLDELAALALIVEASCDYPSAGAPFDVVLARGMARVARDVARQPLRTDLDRVTEGLEAVLGLMSYPDQTAATESGAVATVVAP